MGLKIEEIDETNMFEVFQSGYIKQMKNVKGYTNRKWVLGIERRLKECLLGRYGLVEIVEVKGDGREGNVVKKKQKMKNLGNKLDKNNLNNELIYKKSVKKLFNLMR